jgi:hypothetical protein
MLLENRRWFQLTTCGLGIIAAGLSYWVVRSAIPVDVPESAKFALLLLTVGAISGFSRLLTTLLPLFLLKISPNLDS